jgi:hypothetical protein
MSSPVSLSIIGAGLGPPPTAACGPGASDACLAEACLEAAPPLPRRVAKGGKAHPGKTLPCAMTGLKT